MCNKNSNFFVNSVLFFFTFLSQSYLNFYDTLLHICIYVCMYLFIIYLLFIKISKFYFTEQQASLLILILLYTCV